MGERPDGGSAISGALLVAEPTGARGARVGCAPGVGGSCPLRRGNDALARPNALEGVGAAEAPRGTLFHHYKIDEQGLIRWCNLIIATGQNNLAMNRSVLQVAQRFVQGERLTHGMLNRVEAVIRAYDPCLSCSTHAVGEMALEIQLVSPDGGVLDAVRR